MQWKRIGLVLAPAVLLLVLLAGCETKTAAPASAAATPVTTAKTQYVELMYPQSDDQGNYVTLPESGEVTVSGIIAALTPPTGVVVNGVTVQPYPVQDLAPFGTPAGYSTYGFSAPATVEPTTLLSVALELLGVTSPATTFAPNASSTYSRLFTLAQGAPKDPAAQYRLGNVLLAQKNYDDALAAYNRSLALQPQFAWGEDGLGQTYVMMQRPKDAVIHFKKAKKLHPKWAGPRYRLAEVYTSQKQHEEAMAEYREALSFAPGHPGLHRGYAVALYNRGQYEAAWNQVHLAKKNGAKAPEEFEKRLRERMPEPSKRELPPGQAKKQNDSDKGRQDGVRADGPNVGKPTNKNDKRQDGVRRDGPHAEGKTNKGKGN
ncbi:MAG: tetratricopeptide repeat protein [Armatimonadota bacterium]